MIARGMTFPPVLSFPFRTDGVDCIFPPVTPHLRRMGNFFFTPEHISMLLMFATSSSTSQVLAQSPAPCFDGAA